MRLHPAELLCFETLHGSQLRPEKFLTIICPLDEPHFLPFYCAFSQDGPMLSFNIKKEEKRIAVCPDRRSHNMRNQKKKKRKKNSTRVKTQISPKHTWRFIPLPQFPKIETLLDAVKILSPPVPLSAADSQNMAKPGEWVFWAIFTGSSF